MMKDWLVEYISTNKYVLLIAVCLVSSVVVPLMFNQLPYVLGLVLLGGRQLANYKKIESSLFILFIVVLFLSCLFTWCFSSRFFIFVFVLFVTSGILYSDENYYMRVDMLTVILDVLFVLNILNIICYVAGVNYYTVELLGGKNYFSGLTPHPMWMAVVAGVANIVNVKSYMETDDKFTKAVLAVVVLLTVFLQVTAGSRAGLLATVVGVLVYLKSYIQNMSKVIGYVFVASVVIYVFSPWLMSDAGLLQEKVETQDMDDNSRTVLWNARWDEFLSSPIVGIGFARGYVDGELVEGRLETGSGWLAVLSQTGLLAFLCVMGIVVSIFKTIGNKYLENKELFLAVFVFLCVHSVFEGYLYTSFYMPCLLFWLLAGILMQAPYVDDVEFEGSEGDEGGLYEVDR